MGVLEDWQVTRAELNEILETRASARHPAESEGENMKTIYVVTSGEYSDCSVHVICLTRELAETVAAKINAHTNHYDAEVTVEEKPLAESADDVHTVVYYIVEIDADGRELDRRTFDSWSCYESPIETRVGTPLYGPGAILARGVSERGYDVALKAARDALATHKAKLADV